jgi:hypothetical protein
MERLSWRQSLHAKVKTLGYRDVLFYVGASAIYFAAIFVMIILPLKLIPQSSFPGQNGLGPNIANNNNYLPAYCSMYTVLANGAGQPLSDGPLKLPLQRPEAACRTFTSSVMEKLITNITGRMVDKDLARLFENAYPNTLGILSFGIGLQQTRLYHGTLSTNQIHFHTLLLETFQRNGFEIHLINSFHTYH